MINLETNSDSLYISSLKLHLDYINHVLSLSSDRLPRILAEKVIELKVFWAKDWENLKTQLNLYLSNEVPFCKYSTEILSELKYFEYSNAVVNATNSQFHDLYSKLEYNIFPLPIDLTPRASSLIIRARGGLLDINARCFKTNTDGICTICNLDTSENT